MHEFGLVLKLFEELSKEQRARDGCRIGEVVVEVGPLSGVVADSFAFAFDAVKERWPFARDSRLRLDLPPPVWRCPDCGHEETSERDHGSRGMGLGVKQCPACSKGLLVLQGSRDILLKSIEFVGPPGQARREVAGETDV